MVSSVERTTAQNDLPASPPRTRAIDSELRAAPGSLVIDADDGQRSCSGRIYVMPVVGQLAPVAPEVARTMRDVLARGLADAVARFGSCIKQVMADEQRHIAAQREKLSHLVKSRDKLIAHDRTLAAVQRATATLSRGLCS